MKRILYASGSVLTGDDMARAVVEYATALARGGTADTICVPVMTDNRLRTVDMLVGPSSQLIVEDAEPGVAEGFDDKPYLSDVEEKCERMRNPAPIPVSGEVVAPAPRYNEDF